MEIQRTIEKRFLLSPEEDKRIHKLVNELGRRLGCSLSLSHLLRSSLLVLTKGTKDFTRVAEKRPQLRRPPNQDRAALARFEKELARIIVQGIRSRGFRL